MVNERQSSSFHRVQQPFVRSSQHPPCTCALRVRVPCVKMFSAAAVAVCLAITAYAYLRYVYSYWWRHGFPHLTPSIPVGNLGSVVAGRASIGVRLHQLYEQASTPFVGIYMLFKPVLLIRDAALARRILSADFAHFHDRGVYCNPKYDPLSENLFAMTGHRWRALRSKLTPTFTTGKLKSMLSNISVESDRLLAYLGGAAERAELVEVKDLMSRYSETVSFGLKRFQI